MFAEICYKNSNLDDPDISSCAFLPRTNPKQNKIFVPFKMVKGITGFDFSCITFEYLQNDMKFSHETLTLLTNFLKNILASLRILTFDIWRICTLMKCCFCNAIQNLLTKFYYEKIISFHFSTAAYGMKLKRTLRYPTAKDVIWCHQPGHVILEESFSSVSYAPFM